MSLKDDKQQNIQMKLDFSSALTGAARGAAGEETESLMTQTETGDASQYLARSDIENLAGRLQFYTSASLTRLAGLWRQVAKPSVRRTMLAP
jgi:hypothetical protein